MENDKASNIKRIGKGVVLFLMIAAFGIMASGDLFLWCIIIAVATVVGAIFLKLKPDASFFHLLTTAIITYGLIALVLFVIGVIGMKKHTTPVTDIKKYDKLLKKAKSNPKQNIFHHFPDSIPSDAENVYFHYKRAFLQGDGHFELYFKTSPEKIEEYFNRFSKISTKTYPANGTMYYYRSDGASMELDLKDDFVFMRFDEDPNNIQEHEDEHGVLISRTRNEIVFWAEGVF